LGLLPCLYRKPCFGGARRERRLSLPKTLFRRNSAAAAMEASNTGSVLQRQVLLTFFRWRDSLSRQPALWHLASSRLGAAVAADERRSIVAARGVAAPAAMYLRRTAGHRELHELSAAAEPAGTSRQRDLCVTFRPGRRCGAAGRVTPASTPVPTVAPICHCLRSGRICLMGTLLSVG